MESKEFWLECNIGLALNVTGLGDGAAQPGGSESREWGEGDHFTVIHFGPHRERSAFTHVCKS